MKTIKISPFHVMISRKGLIVGCDATTKVGGALYRLCEHFKTIAVFIKELYKE